MSEITVFISYSYDSDTHREKVLALSERLRADGIETLLDQYVNGSPEQGWPRWMLDQLDAAGSVLVVCTETYYRRFRGHEAPGKGKGVDWEGALITQELYDSRRRRLKFVPVFLSEATEDWIPEPLRSGTHYALTSEDAYQRLYDFLLEQAHVESAPIGTLKYKAPRRAAPLTFESETPPSNPPPASSPTVAAALLAGAADGRSEPTGLRVRISGIASCVSEKLVGRRVLLSLLLIAVLIIAAISWWTSRNILWPGTLKSIVSEFVNDRISAQLKQYYDKERVDEKTRDHELLRDLEIKHRLFSGTLTRRYFDRIEELAQEPPADPVRLIDALVVNYRFAEAESLAVTLATKAEKKTFPNYRELCERYNTAGWMALCQEGYPGDISQWLAVSQDQYERASRHFYKADDWANKSQNRQLWAGPQYGIAAVRFRRGDCQGAMSPIKESVLVRLEEKGDEKNSSDLEARTLLGQVLLECGDVTEAERELKAVYDIRKANFPENPDTLRSWCNWGNALRAQKDNKAEEEHRNAFEKCRSRFGSENLLTLYCHFNYAETLSELGKDDKAESEFRTTAQILNKRYGLKNRLTLDSLYQFARHLRKTGRLDEAATVSKQVADGRGDLLGKEHPDTISAQKLVGEIESGK